MQRQRSIYLLHTKCRCCEIDTVCGRSLKEGVVFVGSISLVISVVIFLSAVTTLGTIASSKKLYNKNPIVAINLIFGLVTSCLSSYQIVISSLLLWQAFKTKGNIFLLSLWYVSHMSLLTMYLLLFSAKAAVSFIKRHNITAVITMFIGIVYEATFIYFAIVVNSYLHSLNQERYL